IFAEDPHRDELNYPAEYALSKPAHHRYGFSFQDPASRLPTEGTELLTTRIVPHPPWANRDLKEQFSSRGSSSSRKGFTPATARRLGDLQVTVQNVPPGKTPRASAPPHSPVVMPKKTAPPPKSGPSVSFGAPQEDKMSISASEGEQSAEEADVSVGRRPAAVAAPSEADAELSAMLLRAAEGIGLEVPKAKALKELHEGSPDQAVMQELRAATDFALRVAKVTARSLGQVMSTLVVQERHLWLNLAQMADVDKARFLDTPVSQAGLFGDTVEDFAQQFSAVQKQTEAIKHILPRQETARKSPGAQPQPARRRGRPPRSTNNLLRLRLKPTMQLSHRDVEANTGEQRRRLLRDQPRRPADLRSVTDTGSPEMVEAPLRGTTTSAPPLPFASTGTWEEGKRCPMRPDFSPGRSSFWDQSPSSSHRLPQRGHVGQRSVKLFRHKTAVPLKTFQRLLGHIAAAVTPLGLLHMRPLKRWLHDRVPRWAWHRGTLRIGVSPQCRRLFSPWSDPAFLRGGVPLGQVSRHVVVHTDASTTGWGAVCNGQAASGSWTGPQLLWHINCLKLLAVLLALRRFLPMLHHKHVLVRTDNTATVAYINRQGGLRSRRMSQLARHLLLWSQTRLKSLRAVHIPGELNRAADQLSRQPTHPGEWRLHPQTVQLIWSMKASRSRAP
ncbi:hypothetical protein M9458_053755, partial [Cirrhinus mrigala]